MKRSLTDSKHEVITCWREKEDRFNKTVKVGDQDLEPLGMHSDEFEWGYEGSGPSELALTICTRWFGIKNGRHLYQLVKSKFIATLPITGGTIIEDHVREWVAAQKIAAELAGEGEKES